MRIHEFGRENEKVIVLIHPSAVMWDYFEFVIPLLEKDYRVIVPALPGYDEKRPNEDFTSVAHVARALVRWFNKKDIYKIDVLYGCSMGGSIVLRMLADHQIDVKNAIADGGITPYQLPWLVTRMIAVRDFLMIAMGKIGGLKLLEKAFSTDEYSDEDLKYLAKVLRFMSFKTIWRTFESCNNYKMPSGIIEDASELSYWYGDQEKKDRAWDIRYVLAHFPQARFVEMKNCGHAGMAAKHPKEMARRIEEMIS